MLRALVIEEAYAVVARVQDEEFRSDRVAAGIRIEREVRARGRMVEVVEEDDGAISVRVVLGDAPEADFEEAGGELLEAASW